MPAYSIGDVVVDTDSIEVTGPEGVREIEPQVFDVLRYLIEQPGRLVTKEELLDNVWGDRFVSESALTTRIKQARRAVDDDGRRQWVIKTVHGRGYRLVADIEILGQGDEVTVGSPSSTDPLPPELVVETRQRFVGRGAELEQAVRVFSTYGLDAAGWVWLLGEPGIGKTRLAAEIASKARANGQRVLFGRNNEDLRVPHQPFIEVFRAVLEQLDGSRREKALAALSPQLGPLLPGFVDPDGFTESADNATDSATRQYQLFEEVALWLQGVSSERPLTLIIDDLHWASDSTLQLLSYLQQRQPGTGSITFVITARDTAPDIQARVVDLLAAGQGLPRTEIVRLGGLSDIDAQHFVAADVALDDVMQQTAGNPLLLQAVNPEDGSVDIESAVHRRLASLDAAVQETLQVASILGLEFELRVAALATGRDELDLLDELEQANAARLLDDVGADRFRFAHALVRSTLREAMSSARRARLHKRIAEAMATLFAEDSRHLQALAFHTAGAVEADRSIAPLAVDRLERAAHDSMVQLSFDDAERLLARAIGLVEDEDVHRRAALTVQLGLAQTRAGAAMTAAHTFEEAMLLAEQAGDLRQRIEAALRYEDAIWRPGLPGSPALANLDAASEALDAAIATGETVDDELELRTRLAIAKLRASALSGRNERAAADFAATHELARQLGSADLEGSLLNVYLSHVLLIRGLRDTEPLVDRLVEVSPEIDDAEVALHAIHVRSLHAVMNGRHDQARDLAAQMAEIQRRSHSAFWRFITLNYEAMDAFYLGDIVEAERLANACLAVAEQLPEEDGSGTFGLRMFMIRRAQDRLGSIAPLVRQVLSAGDVNGVWTPGMALLLVETGALEEAEAALADIKAANFAVAHDAMWSTVFAFLIESMVALGDVESCRELRARFQPLAGTTVTTGSGLLSFGSADRYLGMLSYVLGDHSAAEESLGTALEVDARGGSVIWENEARLWLARVRRAQGHAAEADAMLRAVIDQTRPTGLDRLVRLATEALAT